MEAVLEQHPTLHLRGMQHICLCALAPLPGDQQHLGVQLLFMQVKGVSNPKASPGPPRASSLVWLSLALPMASAP